MRRLLLALVLGSFASVVACSVENNPSPAPAPGDPNTGSDPGDPNSPTDPSKPAASTTAAEVDIDGTCTSFSACGGAPQGTYDYTGGCIEDVFAQARNACPALDTSKANVTVKGSIYFAGNALTRDVSVTLSGSITLPQSCTAGMCSAIETQLKSAFDSVSCSGSSDCTCTISKTDVEKSATTYTVSGNTATTADGETYSICEQGADFKYSGKSAGSEEGVYTLKKR